MKGDDSNGTLFSRISEPDSDFVFLTYLKYAPGSQNRPQNPNCIETIAPFESFR
jgi:hypothetical protein